MKYMFLAVSLAICTQTTYHSSFAAELPPAPAPALGTQQQGQPASPTEPHTYPQASSDVMLGPGSQISGQPALTEMSPQVSQMPMVPQGSCPSCQNQAVQAPMMSGAMMEVPMMAAGPSCQSCQSCPMPCQPGCVPSCVPGRKCCFGISCGCCCLGISCIKCCWDNPCQMPPHYAYSPACHGYYYFAPYNYQTALQHKEYAQCQNHDPRFPYHTPVFKQAYNDLYAEFELKLAGQKAERLKTDDSLPNVEDILKELH
jgi:hypothetical protein